MGTTRPGNPRHYYLIDCMPDLQDQHYLAEVQYKDASHLNARIQLHRRFSTNSYGWFRWVFDQLNLPRNADILEIGCGAGTLWMENIARIPATWRMFLSDFSPGMVLAARKNIGLTREKFTYDTSDGIALPFPSGTFDAAIANHVLFHLPDRKKALAEIHRVLKAGGRFFASTIGENHLLELYTIINDFVPSGGKHCSPGLNPHAFTLQNGLDQLIPWFTQVEVQCYQDDLVITEDEPLVAYILSMIPGEEITWNESSITRLSALIRQQIDQKGSIYIRKSSGMFICKRD